MLPETFVGPGESLESPEDCSESLSESDSLDSLEDWFETLPWALAFVNFFLASTCAHTKTHTRVREQYDD